MIEVYTEHKVVCSSCPNRWFARDRNFDVLMKLIAEHLASEPRAEILIDHQDYAANEETK